MPLIMDRAEAVRLAGIFSNAGWSYLHTGGFYVGGYKDNEPFGPLGYDPAVLAPLLAKIASGPVVYGGQSVAPGTPAYAAASTYNAAAAAASQQLAGSGAGSGAKLPPLAVVGAIGVLLFLARRRRA